MKDKATESEPTTEQRAEDQDAAMVSAFIAGTLPEEDRREVPPERPPVPCDTNGLPLSA